MGKFNNEYIIQTHFAKASQHHVRLVEGQAILSPDSNGECRITPATSCRCARSMVGTVPIL